MKQIELTEEHKKKLLEMCNKLFPTCEWHFWQSEEETYPNDQMIGYPSHMRLGKDKKMIPYLEIHWYEFCMTHLAKKLGKAYGESFYEMCYNHHPIDYLYSEFKKLEL